MKLKVCAISLALFSSTAFAEDYRSFSNARYAKFDSVYRDVNYFDQETQSVRTGDYRIRSENYLFNSTYYFADRTTEGPLKEFEYINAISNIFADYTRHEGDVNSSDYGTLGGEYFAGNFKIGGSYGNLNSSDVYTASLGYLFTPNFIASIESFKVESGDADYYFDTRYNYQLNDTDYIGVNLRVDDGIDRPSFSTKYFSHLGGEKYLSLTGGVIDVENSDELWNIGAEFYFNKRTSVGLSLEEGDTYGVSFSHFFNKNIALGVSYSSSEPDDGFADYENDVYSLGLTVQL